MLSCRTHRGTMFKLGSRCNAVPLRRAYSHQVRAFPFAVSREKAIDDLSLSASIFTGEKVPGTFLRRFFPSLNLEALRPIRAIPVYLPTWLIEAELKASIWARKLEDDDHIRCPRTNIDHLPNVLTGFNFIPLSMLSLVTPELLKTETVPVSEETKQHDGNDVLCLPFSVTPFHLPDVARELPTSKATIADVLRFEPRSVKETSFAAYPVLVPIYLAQYQAQAVVDGDLQYTTITAFIEAGVPNGRCVAEVLPGVDDLLSAFNVPVPDLFVRGPHAELVRKFATVCSLIAPNATLRHRELIERWADSAMCPAHALERYRDRFFGTTERAARAAVDWADPRIRPFEPAEREANAQWLSSGADLFLLRMMMDVYNSKREVPGGRPGRAERGRVGQDADRTGGEAARGQEAAVAGHLGDPAESAEATGPCEQGCPHGRRCVRIGTQRGLRGDALAAVDGWARASVTHSIMHTTVLHDNVRSFCGP
ncbi:hypothetical protein BD413DRAFT_471753 [Trametes elegans]|nr:hypothetical protein BD413DRAFT_471753 [Trametes elegans]